MHNVHATHTKCTLGEGATFLKMDCRVFPKKEEINNNNKKMKREKEEANSKMCTQLKCVHLFITG